MLFRLLLSIMGCIIATGVLSGSIEDHLKKASEKGDFHQMRNIDFIYLINLDERPEKFAACKKQLSAYGIYPYRFPAINGWKLPLEVINDVGVQYAAGMRQDFRGRSYPLEMKGLPVDETMAITGRTYFASNLSLGAIGCALSHLSILQDAFDSGYETIWVMEDDIAVLDNPHTVSDCIERLDQLVGRDGWDILFTDQDTISNETGGYVICLSYAPRPNFTPADPDRFAQRVKISENFRKVGARYGTYSMIIRRSGIKKLLDFIKQYKLFLPIDMEMTLPPDIRLFTVVKDIVSTQRYAPSDNMLPEFLKKKEISSNS